MPQTVRSFERHDRDQLTELVNLHISAVIPGVAVSVNTVMSQLEREPLETIVDPWVVERMCLVVTDDQDRLHAAALLHRFGSGPGVSPDFVDAGEIRWLIFSPGPLESGRRLLDSCLAVLDAWQVRVQYADGSLPAPACYGVPDSWPHIRSLYSGAGFAPVREETVLAVPCADLIRPRPESWDQHRSVGTLGTRFDLSQDGNALGYIEVCQLSGELAKSNASRGWADVGNLEVEDGVDPETVIPHLYSVGAGWLMRGGIETLLDYHSEEEPPEHLELLQRCGFKTLVTNARGWTMANP